MNRAAIYHVSEYVFAYAVSSDSLKVRLKTARGDFHQCCVYYKNVYDHTSFHNLCQMEKIRSDEYFDWYEGDLFLNEKRFKYYFELKTIDNNIVYYNPDGVVDEVCTPPQYFYLPYLFDEDIPSTPAWAEGAVIYQIFVDRFYNGDNSNDPLNTTDFGEIPGKNTFYGGDIKGVIEKLDYIKELGASVIYLNPVFSSNSYHKYDIKDYYEIDKAYGSKQELRELVKRAHEKDIRVVIDTVFNHCSDKNCIFEDVYKNGEKSKYSGWFDIYSYPLCKNPPNYDSFAGLVPQMPRLNTSNEEVQDYLIKNVEYWTEYLDFDGIRLDVSDEVSHELWKKLRVRIKKMKPDMIIIGEIWNQSTRWLLGDEFDTATNYKFRKSIIEFINDESITNEKLWNSLAHNEMKYKTTTLPYFVNLIGSHDTIRLCAALNENARLARIALGIMLTYTGMPLIYYGDEIGITGGEDPDNRRSMNWDCNEWNMETYNLVKSLSRARKQISALSKGRLYEIKDVQPRIVAFKRVFEGSPDIFVIANLGKSQEKIKVSVLGCDYELVNLIDMKDIYINQENSITIESEDIIVITSKGSVVNGQ